MTRNGKIARLPLAVRQQLNLRLQNGERAQDLLSWLNQLPEVQAILAAHPRMFLAGAVASGRRPCLFPPLIEAG